MRVRPDITVLIQSFLGGGAERSAVRLMNEFANRGIAVEAVVRTPDGVYRKDLDPRIAVIALNGPTVILPIRLAWHLRRTRTRAVLSFLVGFNLIVSAVRTPRVPPVLVLSQQNLVHVPSRTHRWKLQVLRLLPRLYARADFVVGVSEGIATEMIGLGIPESRVRAIPNPIDVIDVVERAMQHQASHRFFDSEAKVVVAVGSLTAQKDYPTLLRAIARVRTQTDVRLLILGEGGLRADLEALTRQLGLEEVVDLPGFQNPPWALMARADLFVLSSVFEGWPNVLMEALALGLPVASTDCATGPREMLDDGRLGSLAAPGDPEDLARAILTELSIDRDGDALTHRAAKWSVPSVADQYLNLLIGGGNGAT